jgi:hypothetical protein
MATTTSGRRRLTEQERAERVAALTAELAAAIPALTDPAGWRSMLEVSARFHGYSLSNRCPRSSSRRRAWRVGFAAVQDAREGLHSMSYAMSAVPNDDGQCAGFRQPDDGAARWTGGRPRLTVGHRPGPAHREGSV